MVRRGVILLSTLVLASLIVITAWAGTREFRTNVRNAWFIVEFQKPTTAKGPAILYVLFYGARPSPADVEAVLRSSLKAAVIIADGRDILATAFDGNDELERALHLRDGSKHVLYSSSDKKMRTYSPY